jgi:hypothetical protein
MTLKRKVGNAYGGDIVGYPLRGDMYARQNAMMNPINHVYTARSGVQMKQMAEPAKKYTKLDHSWPIFGRNPIQNARKAVEEGSNSTGLTWRPNGRINNHTSVRTIIPRSTTWSTVAPNEIVFSYIGGDDVYSDSFKKEMQRDPNAPFFKAHTSLTVNLVTLNYLLIKRLRDEILASGRSVADITPSEVMKGIRLFGVVLDQVEKYTSDNLFKGGNTNAARGFEAAIQGAVLTQDIFCRTIGKNRRSQVQDWCFIKVISMLRSDLSLSFQAKKGSFINEETFQSEANLQRVFIAIPICSPKSYLSEEEYEYKVGGSIRRDAVVIRIGQISDFWELGIRSRYSSMEYATKTELMDKATLITINLNIKYQQT